MGRRRRRGGCRGAVRMQRLKQKLQIAKGLRAPIVFYRTTTAKDLQSTGRLYTSFLGRRRLLRLCLAKLRIRFCSLETGAEQCEARCLFLRRIGADGRRRLATHLSRWHCAIGITAKK